jgi:hypothetical protein
MTERIIIIKEIRENNGINLIENQALAEAEN